MGKKINFDKTIDTKEFRVNSITGRKRLYSQNKRFLHVGETEDSLVCDFVGMKKTPTLNDLFGFDALDDFLTFIGRIFVDDLGFTEEEFAANTKKDPKILDPLYEKWYKTRDASWLYNLKEYAFETLHCNLHVTVKLHKKGSVDKFSTIKNILAHLELLDYDKKESFNVLDLCSGMGLTTLMIAKRFPNANVYYNELNPSSRLIFSKLLDRSGLTNITILNSEEISEKSIEIDVITACEAVEHIPSADFGIGAPFPWLDKFLDKMPIGGHFLYETMWNSEWNNGKTLGHFRTYKFDDVLVHGHPTKGGKVFHPAFQKALERRNIKRVDGKTSLGYSGLKWGLRGGPKVYRKV
tara:strand:- start:5450 stop:6505 length:1056 start_codon:yes stop_codon:yes gene_type:complete